MSAWLAYQIDGVDDVFFFEWDCTLAESHSRPGAATQFPIEDGSVITDHVDLGSVSLSMSGFVTNTPIRKSSAYPINGDGMTRSQQAHDLIVELQKARRVVSVYSDNAYYDSMLIESVSHDRNRSKSSGLWLDVTLREARFVTAQDVLIADNPAPIMGDAFELEWAERQRQFEQKLGKSMLKTLDEIERQEERIVKLEAARKTPEMRKLVDRYTAEDLAEGR